MKDRDEIDREPVPLTGYEQAMPWAAETAAPGTQLRLDTMGARQRAEPADVG